LFWVSSPKKGRKREKKEENYRFFSHLSEVWIKAERGLESLSFEYLALQEQNSCTGAD